VSRATRAAAGLVLALSAAAGLAIDEEPPLADPVQEALYKDLIHEVRCLVCQNQTIGDSTAPLAADLRREVRRLVQEGRSEREVKAFLLDRYGDFVLYRPRFMGSTVLLWLAPVLLVVSGAFVLARSIRRRRELPSDIDADGDASAAENESK
jgi:cytochrome c-type biogenesis protein CcmH